MALAFTNETTGTASARTGTTASVSFANSTLYILSMAAHSTSGANAFVTPVSAGTGITWTQVALSNSSVNTVAIYSAYVDSGAAAGTTALDSGQANTNRLRWSIESVTGSAATSTNGGAAAFGTPGYEQSTGGQASSSVTLGSFTDAVNDAAFGLVFINAGTAITKEATYTQLSAGNSTAGAHLVEYFIGEDLAVTSTFAAGTTVVATAVEVKVAVAAATGSFFPVVVGA